MKVIQITNRDDDWGAQYKQYYFGISSSPYSLDRFTFLIDGIFLSRQYVSRMETTEIT